ncbi:MAG: lysylphosphatidylglycerol synthase domain-containing protein, partial [Chlamydiota bacterium]
KGIRVEKGQILTDKATLGTGKKGVFAGGDAAASAPWTAIEAVAAGSRAARSIHNFLRGEDLLPVYDESMVEAKPDDDVLAKTAVMARLQMPHLPGAARKATWDEVNTGFTEEQSVAEAKRCPVSAICAALALLYSRTLLARVPFAKALLDRMPFRENIRRLYDSLYVYRSHPRVLAKALAISCVMQLIFILIMLGTARALGITGVTYLHLLLLTPLIGTIAAIPLTPSGWGTMEGAFCYFFPAIGVGAEQALALDLVTRVLVISWSLVGGVVYALPRFRGLSE